MTLTQIDARTALIIVDLQQGMLGRPTIDPIDGIVTAAAALADAYRRRGQPVVLVNVDEMPPGRTGRARSSANPPDGWTDLLPMLRQQPDDHIVTKHAISAFAGTDLDAYLRRHDVTQVAVIGVATSLGVEGTARHAYDAGFNVVLPIDAITDLDADAHHNSVTRVFPRIGEVCTVSDLAVMLAGQKS